MTSDPIPAVEPAHDPASAARQLAALVDRAGRGLVDRAALVETVLLGAVAGEHLLVIGPPGTAKSQAVRAVSQALGGRYFEYLLGRFTEPNEIFGPVDLRRLREGVVEIETRGMLPEAEVAFLDEVFLGSSAILNTLLGLLNERRFRRGSTELACPLRICVGASNQLPQEPALAAFADRFLLRVFVDRVSDTQLESLLAAFGAPAGEGGGASAGDDTGGSGQGASGMALVAALADRVGRVDLSGVQARLAEGFRRLRAEGLALSDRRMVRSLRLVAAAALLDGRDRATEADLWPLYYVLPTPEAQAASRRLLSGLWASSRNAALGAAALEASAGPAARADRLCRSAAPLLQSVRDTGVCSPAQRLRLEAIAREMDASYAADQRPPELERVRAELIERLRQVPGGG